MATIKELGGRGLEMNCVWKVLVRGARKGSGQADAGSKAESIARTMARLNFLWKVEHEAAFWVET